MATTWIEHKGKPILFTDFIDCKTEQEMIANLQAAADIYESSPIKILGLYDLSGTTVTDGYMLKAKELAETVFNQKREKSAIIGVTGIKRVLLDAYNNKANNGLKSFDTRDEALEYLVSETTDNVD